MEEKIKDTDTTRIVLSEVLPAITKAFSAMYYQHTGGRMKMQRPEEEMEFAIMDFNLVQDVINKHIEKSKEEFLERLMIPIRTEGSLRHPKSTQEKKNQQLKESVSYPPKQIEVE